MPSASRTIFIWLVALLFTLALNDKAQAHARWRPDGILKPRKAANGAVPDGLKDENNPCGLSRSSGPENLFAPGETINVEWEETIEHLSVFEILLLDKNDQVIRSLERDIPDNQSNGTRSAPARFQLSVTMPSLQECPESCGLMLIQHMDDDQDGIYQPYFSCANIKLTGSTSSDSGDNGDNGSERNPGNAEDCP